MQFSIQNEHFLKVLRAVSGVVERKHAQYNPILANVLLDITTQGRLSVVASDQEVELESLTQASAVKEAGAITVQFKKLHDICRALPATQTLHINVLEGRFCLRAGRSRFSLSTLPAGNYPSIEHGNKNQTLTLSAKKLHRLIEKTAFAMAEQDVRYYLNGMLLEVKQQKLFAVAADGHRLAASYLELTEHVTPTRVIVPRKGVVEMLRLLDDANESVQLSVTQSHLHLHTSTASLTSKLLEGKFPDYERVIPKAGDNVVLGARLKLKEAFHRASALFTDKFRGVRLKISSAGMKILAHNTDQDEVEEDLEVQYQGGELEIGFNVRYLLDFLNTSAAENVRLSFSDSTQSAVLQGDEEDQLVYVVMPMRI